MKKIAVSLFVLSALLASCGNQAMPQASTHANGNSEANQLTDDYLISNIQGFAGFYKDDENNYHILLSNKEISTQSINTRKIDEIINAVYHPNAPIADDKKKATPQAINENPHTEYNYVKYSLKELKYYQDKLDNLIRVEGPITSTSINYVTNKVSIYYSSNKDKESVVKILENLSIPKDIYELAGTLQFSFTASVVDSIRPVGAGLGISSSVGGCSMSVPVKRILNNNITYGFMTARHCTVGLFANVYQGSSLTPIGFTEDEAVLDGQNYINADAAFISTAAKDLRSLSYANIAFGYSSPAQYNGWLKYPSVISNPILRDYAYSYGKRGQVAGKIVLSDGKLPNSRFNVRNVYCFEISQDEYNGFEGQSGGLVLDKTNSVIGIVSGKTSGSNGTTNKYFGCFSSINDSFASLGKGGKFTLY